MYHSSEYATRTTRPSSAGMHPRGHRASQRGSCGHPRRQHWVGNVIAMAEVVRAEPLGGFTVSSLCWSATDGFSLLLIRRTSTEGM